MGKCLASQQIRELIRNGEIITKLDESRIQPSSFEPQIGGEVFVLDEGFRPNKDKSIYRSLLELPLRSRRRVDISEGYELKEGFSYLVPLEDRLSLSSQLAVKSSPKSSLGRLFLNTRLVTDYNDCFDEIRMGQGNGDMWLLVQPLAFNLIVYPGLTLNQLRIMEGHDSKLSIEELLREEPLLWLNDEPVNDVLIDGLGIHLDLRGEDTGGIVALMARRNPEPIDLSKKASYLSEDYFLPLKANDVCLERDRCILVASKEILRVRPDRNVELRANSHLGFSGPLHFAGFIDNGWEGDIVFEIRPTEIGRMRLEDGMPLSILDVYRTDEPDKIYGSAIGSNYKFQKGCRTSKCFRDFDFDHAARNYTKLNREVLVQDANLLRTVRSLHLGFEKIRNEKELLDLIGDGFFHLRYNCEEDPLVLQPIPYILLFNESEKIFAQVRASCVQDYGEPKLFGKHSIGVGGHINRVDFPDYLNNSLRRELREEVECDLQSLGLAGTLYMEDKPVDRVHFGLVYVGLVNGDVSPAECSILSGRMVGIDQIVLEPIERYESWSQALIPHLKELYGSARTRTWDPLHVKERS